MSVFQLNEWWGVQVASAEEFDFGCLCLGNIDNAVPPSDKIAVGSLEGMIRIYNPSKPQYRIEDLILEESLGSPILQLLAGRFIPSTESIGLAVLHPRKLVVYEVSPHGQADGKANYHSLRKAYEHNLGVEGKHFTAYNMISGPFGSARGRDMFMVQSLDGKLQIFEQSATAFTRQLMDCLLPGPMAYLPRLDAFVSTNYATQAECYRYQVLASSQTDVGARESKSRSEGKEGSGALGLSAVRRAMVEWSINLGESCRQIEEGSFTRSDCSTADSSDTGAGAGRSGGEILMLCERSLYVLKEAGGVVQQRRLEKEPSCLCKYRVSSSAGKAQNGSASSGHNFLLASKDGTLSVFVNFNLVWAAKLPTVPVQMAVSDFGGQKGLVVTLDDTGRLSIGFLGTKPPLSAVPSLTSANAREVDYDRLDEEHRGLLQIIRDSQSESKADRKDVDRLSIRSQLPQGLDIDPSDSAGLSADLPADLVAVDYDMEGSGMDGQGGLVKICVRVYLTYNGQEPATNVSLVASCPSFLHVVPRNVAVQRIGGKGHQGTPIMIKLHLYANTSHLPTGLEVEIVASYQTASNEPRVAQHTITVPLLLACRPRPALKAAAHKITLDTLHPALPLSELFADFLSSAEEHMDLGDIGIGGTGGGASSLGFQLWASSVQNTGAGVGAGTGIGAAPHLQPAVVSILVSKNTGRYRVQSDSLPALFLILSELERRLSKHIATAEDISAAYSSSSPSATSSSALSPSKRAVTCDDEYPLDEYFASIRLHFQLRGTLAEQLSMLNNSAHQFRMVQRRLLVRFKDRNPTPLLGLDTLMRESYSALLRISDQVQDSQTKLKRQSGDLACLSRTVVLLATLKCGLSDAERALLESYLCPEGGEGGASGITEQGLEETMDASLTYLLKTALAKNTKESATLSNTTLEMADEVESLVKHIQMVLDRLAKGSKLLPPSSSSLPSPQANKSSPAPSSAQESKSSRK